MTTCKLCDKVKANKKNSHILPHFLIKTAISKEGSKQRDYELTFSFSENEFVDTYFGRSITLDTIENLFDKTVRDAVDAITKRKEESRADYLARCSTNKIARLVKLHDAMFNATNCHKNKNENKFTYYLQTISKLTL